MMSCISLLPLFLLPPPPAVGAIVGGVVGGILLLVVVVVVIIVVVVVAMKVSKKDTKPYRGYKPGYSTSGNGLHHTPSTTRMLTTNNEVTVDIGDGNHNIGDDSTNSFSFFPAPPISPPAAYKPPPPSYHDITRNPAPSRVAPQRPPARRAPPAPKPSPNNVHNEVGQQSSPLANGNSAAHRRPAPVLPPSKPASVQKPSPLVPLSATPSYQPRPPPAAPRPAPSAPPKAEKPVITPKHNVPIKPQLTSRPPPAPKPTPVSTTGVADAPAPKPTPKPKPPVTTEKPKPAVRPNPGESITVGKF